MNYSKAQIAKIMILEELKTIGGAIAILDMRSRAAKAIKKRRASKRAAVGYKAAILNMNMVGMENY